MPLCGLCHVHFHSACGVFKGWTRQQRRDWQDRKVTETRAQHQALIDQEDEDEWNAEQIF